MVLLHWAHFFERSPCYYCLLPGVACNCAEAAISFVTADSWDAVVVAVVVAVGASAAVAAVAAFVTIFDFVHADPQAPVVTAHHGIRIPSRLMVDSVQDLASQDSLCYREREVEPVPLQAHDERGFFLPALHAAAAVPCPLGRYLLIFVTSPFLYHGMVPSF